MLLPFYPWAKYLRPRIYVAGARGYDALKKRLGSRWILNWFWVTTWFDKIRKVRTHDRWWRLCVDLLAENCEVILVDLTVVKAGTRWELAKLRDEHLEERAIFVALRGHGESARAVLAEYWAPGGLPEIHLYDAGGRLDDRGRFVDRFARVLALPRPPVDLPRPAPVPFRVGLAGFAAALAITLGVTALLTLVGSALSGLLVDG